MKNILFIIQTFGTGGSENLVLDICKNLDKSQFRAYAIGLVDGKLRKCFERENIKTLCLDKKRFDKIRIIIDIKKFIMRNNINIINAHHLTPFIYGSIASYLTIKSIYYTVHTSQEVTYLTRFWKFVGKILIKFSTGTIAISQGTFNAILDTFKISNDNVELIINAIDCSKFENDLDIARKKREIGISETMKIIGCVANLRRQKNHANLLKAYKIIRREHSKTCLLIVGEGVQETNLKRLVKDLNIEEDVYFLGARLDVPELMKIMDVYCLASYFEGLPLTLLEAMASEIPVVGTNVDGIKEVIKHENNGLLAENDNEIDLSKCIQKILNDVELRNRLVKNAKEILINTYSKDKWVKKYENLFNRQ
jgi:glycosyltransferase involved in cell wall biosynthesis